MSHLHMAVFLHRQLILDLGHIPLWYDLVTITSAMTTSQQGDIDDWGQGELPQMLFEYSAQDSI